MTYGRVSYSALITSGKISFIRNVFFRLRQVYPKNVRFQTALINFECQVSLVYIFVIFYLKKIVTHIYLYKYIYIY